MECGEGKKQMVQDVGIIKANLEKYLFLKKFLGNIIDQRLGIKGYECGMFAAHLLDDESSKSDLARLENALQLGETYCRDFERIFKSKRLSKVSEIADGQIIDMLAEVKAFEFLHVQGFEGITNFQRKGGTRTVDFTAAKNGRNYAVEVTRLGVPQSARKKPRYMVKNSLPPHNIPGVRQLEGEWFLISGKDNVPRIMEAIRDAIENEYPQIKEFCQRQDNHWNGMLIISTGRDYFVMNKYAKTEFEITPNAVQDALKQVWNLMKEGREDYKYLNHIVIVMGKDFGKAIIYPPL